jgi:hypothetical protein
LQQRWVRQQADSDPEHRAAQPFRPSFRRTTRLLLARSSSGCLTLRNATALSRRHRRCDFCSSFIDMIHPVATCSQHNVLPCRQEPVTKLRRDINQIWSLWAQEYHSKSFAAIQQARRHDAEVRTVAGVGPGGLNVQMPPLLQNLLKSKITNRLFHRKQGHCDRMQHGGKNPIGRGTGSGQSRPQRHGRRYAHPSHKSSL